MPLSSAWLPRYLAFSFFAVTVAPAFAQRAANENVPFSRYGIGEVQSGSSIALRGAGGTTAAASNPFSLNPDNPASYGGLKLTTYEAGFQASRRRATFGSGGPVYESGTATLSYLRVGLPVAKNAGIVLGLQPVSRRYYNLRDTGRAPGLGGLLNTYSGEGGLNQAVFGAGIDLKNFRFGVNGFYTFGTFSDRITRDYYQPDSAHTFGTEILRNTRLGGLGMQLGFQYTQALKNTFGMRVGATASLQQSINATRNEVWNAVRDAATGLTIRDTAYQALEQKGKMKLPLQYSAGIQFFEGNQWTLSAEYGRTDWRSYRLFDAADSAVSTASYVALGGEFTPNNTVTGRYLQRITYRLGFRYTTDPYLIAGAQPRALSGTAGVSLPFKRTTDRVHLALEVGSRRLTGNYPTQETFTRLLVGLSLNDRWFIKRRYD